MGYILPMNSYTYNDYYKRVQPKKTEYYYINELNPIGKINEERHTKNPLLKQTVSKGHHSQSIKGEIMDIYI